MEKCGIANNTNEFLPTELSISTSIPTCPSFQIKKGIAEEGEEPEQEEITHQGRDEDDISPESVTTSTTAESMLDSLTLHSGSGTTLNSPGPEEPLKKVFNLCN